MFPVILLTYVSVSKMAMLAKIQANRYVLGIIKKHNHCSFFVVMFGRGTNDSCTSCVICLISQTLCCQELVE